jgi:hypothetical protein
MSSHGAGAHRAAVRIPGARAAASRANGAKSHGPRTAEGKARSAQNALKHGLSARKHVLLPDDSRAEFTALESALLDDLRPEGALQTLLAHRLIAAAWRLARADRLEFGLLTGGDAFESPGRALVRGGRAAGVFATLVRYRGGAQAELFRTLKVLKALQAEAALAEVAPEAPLERTRSPEPRPGVAPVRVPAEGRPPSPLREVAAKGVQDQAEPRTSVQARDAKATRNEPKRPASGHQCATKATRNEPEHPERTFQRPFQQRVQGSDKRRGPTTVVGDSRAKPTH